MAALALTRWLMQLTNRRKLFLQIYAGMTAAAFLVPIVSSTWTGMLIFAVLSGAAYGYSLRLTWQSCLTCCLRATLLVAISVCLPSRAPHRSWWRPA